jgi:hypothetical protein
MYDEKKISINDLFDELLEYIGDKIDHNLSMYLKFILIYRIFKFIVFITTSVSAFVLIQHLFNNDIYLTNKLLGIFSLIVVNVSTIIVSIGMNIRNQIFYYCCMRNMYNHISIEIYNMPKRLSDDVYIYKCQHFITMLESLANYKKN